MINTETTNKKPINTETTKKVIGLGEVGFPQVTWLENWEECIVLVRLGHMSAVQKEWNGQKDYLYSSLTTRRLQTKLCT